MRLGRVISYNCEYEMQERMCEWLQKKELKYKDEVRVKEVGRIADFLAVKDRKLINIEAKCADYSCMMKQLCDHAVYCDYSFAFITNYALTPKDFKRKLAERGFGLIVWDNENKTITEVLEAHHNKPENKELRKKHFKEIAGVDVDFIPPNPDGSF